MDQSLNFTDMMNVDLDIALGFLNERQAAHGEDASTNTQEDMHPVDKAEAFQSNKQQTCLLFRGHTYNFHYNKKSQEIVWRCCNRPCKGKITTTTSYNVNLSTTHSDDCNPMTEAAGRPKIGRSRILTDRTDTTTKSLAQQNGHPYNRNPT